MKIKAKRFYYLLYYFSKLDRKKLRKFLKFSSAETGRSQSALFISAIRAVFRYNVSILDYFFFRFFEKDREECMKWAGTGYMFEYQKLMNPLDVRGVLENKISFSTHFHPFIKRDYAVVSDVIQDATVAQRLIDNPSGKLVVKASHGQAGQEIKVLDCKGLIPKQLGAIMKKGKYDLVEEYILQHPDMMSLSPSGLNTVRIITQEVDGKVDILAARLRISINSHVDNLAAGNAAVPLDKEHGRVIGPGVFSDITMPDIDHHPVTGLELPGFQVPFWEEIIQMVKEAALMAKNNRSIGWDVAVTSDGPLLIEGNHNWCKILWQLPVRQGLKAELLKYL